MASLISSLLCYALLLVFIKKTSSELTEATAICNQINGDNSVLQGLSIYGGQFVIVIDEHVFTVPFSPERINSDLGHLNLHGGKYQGLYRNYSWMSLAVSALESPLPFRLLQVAYLPSNQSNTWFGHLVVELTNATTSRLDYKAVKLGLDQNLVVPNLKPILGTYGVATDESGQQSVLFRVGDYTIEPPEKRLVVGVPGLVLNEEGHSFDLPLESNEQINTREHYYLELNDQTDELTMVKLPKTDSGNTSIRYIPPFTFLPIFGFISNDTVHLVLPTTRSVLIIKENSSTLLFDRNAANWSNPVPLKYISVTFDRYFICSTSSTSSKFVLGLIIVLTVVLLILLLVILEVSGRRRQSRKSGGVRSTSASSSSTSDGSKDSSTKKKLSSLLGKIKSRQCFSPVGYKPKKHKRKKKKNENNVTMVVALDKGKGSLVVKTMGTEGNKMNVFVGV